jgi:hypothetical protein
VGQTELNGVAPNVGPSAFRTDFGGFNNEIVDSQPNALFSSNALSIPFASLDVLLNTPVTGVEFAYALRVPGTLSFGTENAGTGSQSSSNVGGPFPGGTFMFSSQTPFTHFSLQSFASAPPPVLGPIPNLLAIDNLTLTTRAVPEPSTSMLLSVVLTGFLLAHIIGAKSVWRLQ